MSAILSRSEVSVLPGSDTSLLMYVFTVVHFNYEIAAVPRAQTCQFPTLTNKKCVFRRAGLDYTRV